MTIYLELMGDIRANGLPSLQIVRRREVEARGFLPVLLLLLMMMMMMQGRVSLLLLVTFVCALTVVVLITFVTVSSVTD
jgi:Ca2+/Na+ antiporter